MNVPIVIDPEDFPKMYNDSDSVSTFHRPDEQTQASCTPSTKFTPVIVSNPPSIILFEILSLLQQHKPTQDDPTIIPAAQDNPLKQLPDTDGSSGVAGTG